MAQSFTNTNKKSEDYLKWDDYFMALAALTAKRSKDPKKKVGACVVNDDNRVVALGYNGMPNGCNDDEMEWGKEGDWLKTKYPYVCHAEMNAIMNKTSSDLKNCRIYTTKFPCNECAKLIIQSGIRTVIYLSSSDPSTDKDTVVAAKKLFSIVGIAVRQHAPIKPVTLTFD